MKRRFTALVLAAILSSSLVGTHPAAAQGGGCREFGQNIASLAQTLGPVFGQTAASGAPLNDTVAAEQDALCN